MSNDTGIAAMQTFTKLLDVLQEIHGPGRRKPATKKIIQWNASGRIHHRDADMHLVMMTRMDHWQRLNDDEGTMSRLTTQAIDRKKLLRKRMLRQC